MVEPTGHCPYLGLKQNRAIRFASPTPEHRCYVSGEPLDIPVDQSSYCLSQGHVHCPLYMGLSAPTTNDTPTVIGETVAAPSGVRGWFAALPPRDRVIYTIMIVMLAIIIAIYLFVGLPAILGILSGPGAATPSTAAPIATQPVVGAPTAVPASPTDQPPTAVPPTPTDLPTRTPGPAPTAEPTQPTLIIFPTSAPTQLPTASPTQGSVAGGPTALPTQGSVAGGPTALPTQGSVAGGPTAAPQTTAVVPSATSQPVATARPAATPRPTQAPANPPPSPRPTQPPANVSTQALTLYFGDATGTLYVPVRRNATVEDDRVAEAAIRELIAGPRNGLGRLVPNDATLLGVTIAGGTATANFNRTPSADGDRGLDAIVFTLTEFPSVQRVQFQVNGRNLGGARGRPVVNPINPDNLPDDKGVTEYLPIYFPSIDNTHDIRFIRMVPKTKQTAEGTVRALLEGPGGYDYAVKQVIPASTELRGIRLNNENGVVMVDFTQPFAGASDSAIRTIVESLTTLRTISGVQFLVEGQPFADGRVFRRPAINQE